MRFATTFFGVLSLACFIVEAEFGYGQERGIADFPSLSAEQDWPWWRGPQRNGYALKADVPLRFGETENVRWRVPVPGRGHSSPIVVGDSIYLATADEAAEIQSVIAFDRQSGNLRWKQELNQGGFPANNHPKNTEASPTIASDGERLYVTFFHHQSIELCALAKDGSIQWRQKVLPFDPKKYEYGYAPSPLLYRETVIVSAEHDGESGIVAIDRQTGTVKWKTARPENITFSSPVVAHVGGRDQLLLSGSQLVCSYDPMDGKLLWEASGTTAATCGTMVWDDQRVYASGGYPKAETLAIQGDGSGKVLWKNGQKCYEQSMIVVDGYLYALTDRGVLFCWRGSDGHEMWQVRLQGPVSASPVLAGGAIYWANEKGTHYVFRPNPERFELLSENQLGDESFASPAVSGKQMYLRVAHLVGDQRQEFLYCLAKD